jgi:hypothetical protein
MNDDGVAIVGSTQVGDPDGLWTADVDGSATGIMVEMTNAIAVGVKRPIQFFHLPVPKGRTDDAYYVRLHHDDAEGDAARLAVARRHVRVDGIATECGMARGDSARLPGMLAAHARAAEIAP